MYEETYEQSPFIRICTQGKFPSPKEVRGSNYCDIGIAYDERTERVTVVSVIDNMMKGAAGQAIQKCKHNSGTRRDNRFTTYAALSIRGT